jgi:hypothetical protein
MRCHSKRKPAAFTSKQSADFCLAMNLTFCERQDARREAQKPEVTVAAYQLSPDRLTNVNTRNSTIR